MYTDAEEHEFEIEAAREDVANELLALKNHGAHIGFDDWLEASVSDLYIIANNFIAAARRLQTATDRLRAAEGA